MASTKIHFNQDKEISVIYQSGLTCYSESLSKSKWVGRDWSVSGFIEKASVSLFAAQKKETANLPIEAFDLEVDGHRLHHGWRFVSFEKPDENHCTVTLESDILPVRLAVHTKLDGTAILTRWLEVTNCSDKACTLGRIVPFSGVLCCSPKFPSEMHRWGHRFPENPQGTYDDKLFTLGYFHDSAWGLEGNYQTLSLPDGTYSLSSSSGRSGHSSPFFTLKNELDGTVFIGSLEWSGNWKMDFHCKKDSLGAEAWLAFQAQPVAPCPMRILSPGETVKSPVMHIGQLAGNLDDAIGQMHDHIRSSVMPEQIPGREFLTVFNHWSYTEHELSEEKLFHEIDVASSVGSELFVVDAGWYADKDTDWWQTTGDWKVGNRLPNGLDPIREYAHKKGLLFGLWGEVERAGIESQTAKDYPDWFLTRDGETIQTALDLSKAEVADHVEATIANLIETHQLDLFRLDFNIRVGEGGYNTRNGLVENTHYRYYENLYGIFDRLRERFPNVIFENCASGGGRTDLGMVSRFHHTWVTDWQVAPSSIRIVNGMSMALPPEYIDRFGGVGQGSHLQGDLGFQMRSCMLGHFTLSGLCPKPGTENPTQLDFVRHCVSLYKNSIRPILPESRIYHHTPVLAGRAPRGWCVIELAHKDTSKAVAGLFRLDGHSETEYLLKPRGLNRGKTYRLTYDNSGQSTTANGRELMENGVTVRLDYALTSELLLIEEC